LTVSLATAGGVAGGLFEAVFSGRNKVGFAVADEVVEVGALRTVDVGDRGVESGAFPLLHGLIEVGSEGEAVGVYVAVYKSAGVDEGPVLESK
jgi:hypothetical protein